VLSSYSLTDYLTLGASSPYRSNFKSDTAIPAGCTPKHFNFAARHGTRYPTKGQNTIYGTLSSTLQANAAQIKNSSYAWLATWKPAFSSSDLSDLSFAGSNEHFDLGKRLGQRFPLLQKRYREDTFHIQTTQVSRAAQSANAFALGLFAGTGNFSAGLLPDWWTYSETPKDDNYLRYFDNCQNYIKLDTPDATAAEQDAWGNANFGPIGDRLQQWLGGTWTPDPDTVFQMWEACRDEYTLLGLTKFCDLFLQEETEVLTYMDDLDYYVSKGYWNPLNYQMAATLVDDIVLHMIQAINGSSDQKLEAAKLRFAHAETVVPLLAFLGLYKDPFPISANITPTDRANRLFRTSTGIGFYALNIIFDMYSCSDGTYKVRVLVNEEEVQIPGCPEIYCDFDTFVSTLGYNHYPSFSTVCTPTSSPIDPTPSSPGPIEPTTPVKPVCNNSLSLTPGLFIILTFIITLFM